MIRTQQQQLQQMREASGQPHATPPAIDDSTPTSERSMSFSNPTNPPQPPAASSTPRSPSISLHPRSPMENSRNDLPRRSRTSSQQASPRLRPAPYPVDSSSHDFLPTSGRDESAFYQAETQMMVRENQMLRQRIRELGM